MEDIDIESELLSLRSKLSMEIENNLKQIEILKKRISKDEILLQAVKGRLGANAVIVNSKGYGAKLGIIRDAINRIPRHRFTQNDVESEMMRVNAEVEINRNRIRSALWTMVSRKQLKLIRKGTNRLPAEYEKIEDTVRTKRITEQAPKNDANDGAVSVSLLQNPFGELSVTGTGGEKAHAL